MVAFSVDWKRALIRIDSLLIAVGLKFLMQLSIIPMSGIQGRDYRAITLETVWYCDVALWGRIGLLCLFLERELRGLVLRFVPKPCVVCSLIVPSIDFLPALLLVR